MVRIRGRAIPVELRVAEGHDRGSVSGRVDFYPRQEWPGTNRLCHHELREPRRVPRLGRHKALLQRKEVIGRGRRLVGKVEADREIRERGNCELHGIADDRGSLRDRHGRSSSERQYPIGGGFDVRTGGSPRYMRTPEDQRSVAVGVRQPDPELRPSDAGMNDEPEGLISERLETPGHGWLRCRRPGPNPPGPACLSPDTGE